MRGQTSQPTHLKDFFEKVSYRDDLKMLEISGLPAGEYVLMKLYPYLASVIIRIGTLLDAAGAITQEKYDSPPFAFFIIFVIFLYPYLPVLLTTIQISFGS